jgi:hypothetical protein
MMFLEKGATTRGGKPLYFLHITVCHTGEGMWCCASLGPPITDANYSAYRKSSSLPGEALSRFLYVGQIPKAEDLLHGICMPELKVYDEEDQEDDEIDSW